MRLTAYSVPCDPAGLLHFHLSSSAPPGLSPTFNWYGVPGGPTGAGVAGTGRLASV